MQVTQLTPVIGAEIAGLDLTRLSDNEFAELQILFTQHSVLFFRDQAELSPEQQVSFAKKFGPLHTHPAAPTKPGHPEVFVIHAHADSKVANGNGWHTDVSCDQTPPLATMLQLHTLPRTGGDTLFSSMYAAYETLSPTMQNFLCGLNAVHESAHVYKGRYADRGVADEEIEYPSSTHPVVRTHPESGRRALYVNPSFTTRIEGLATHESASLLKFIYEHQQRAEFQIRFKWSTNAIALWDNRCTQHFALWDYWPEERKGHRVTIKGEQPFLDLSQNVVDTNSANLRVARQL